MAISGQTNVKDKWYFTTYILVIAFVCVGPLAIFLACLNPNYSIKKKIVISMIMIILSILLGVVFTASVKSILNYYNEIFKLG